MNGSTQLPRFGRPPVSETLLGVEFKPLEKWEVPHFGLYWHEIRAEFPQFQVKPPLASQIERFNDTFESQQQIRFVSRPEVRCWYLKADEGTLIQVQRDRFVVNWRKSTERDQYPHYEETIRPFFLNEFRRFGNFVARNQLGTLEAVQCEVSYINTIERNSLWRDANDLGNVFSCWARDFKPSFLPIADDIDFGLHFAMPNNSGRLHIALQPAIRNPDKEEVLQFTLTARGSPEKSDESSILAFLDLGREWVVRAFLELTSAKMHQFWERKA